MKKRRKLNTNEKFLISFLIILIVAIAFNWGKFSERLKSTYNKYQQTEEPAK